MCDDVYVCIDLDRDVYIRCLFLSSSALDTHTLAHTLAAVLRTAMSLLMLLLLLLRSLEFSNDIPIIIVHLYTEYRRFFLRQTYILHIFDTTTACSIIEISFHWWLWLHFCFDRPHCLDRVASMLEHLKCAHLSATHAIQ